MGISTASILAPLLVGLFVCIIFIAPPRDALHIVLKRPRPIISTHVSFHRTLPLRKEAKDGEDKRMAVIYVHPGRIRVEKEKRMEVLCIIKR